MSIFHAVGTFFHWIHIHSFILVGIWLCISAIASLWFTQDTWRGNPRRLSGDEIVPWRLIVLICLAWPLGIIYFPLIFILKFFLNFSTRD